MAVDPSRYPFVVMQPWVECNSGIGECIEDGCEAPAKWCLTVVLPTGRGDADSYHVCPEHLGIIAAEVFADYLVRMFDAYAAALRKLEGKD